MPTTIRLPDPESSFSAVRLVSDLPLDDQARTFTRVADDCWELRLPDELRLRRLEYLVEIDEQTRPDPVNEATAPGAFGDKSVWQADDYAPPWWCGGEAIAARMDELVVRSRAVRVRVPVRLWTPTEDVDPEAELPLLVVNDGTEYDRLAGLLHFVSVMLGDYTFPRCRVALLDAGRRRDNWYSANPAYARALATEILPAITEAFPTRAGATIGMGCSLGGLAMLHAQRSHPGTFAGLFLQSASFFTPRFDEHESGFSQYRRIVRFVRAVEREPSQREPLPVVMTCGTEEENIHNNRMMCAALARQGYDVTLHEVPDLHNYTAWRDALDPHLTELLAGRWSARTP